MAENCNTCGSKTQKGKYAAPKPKPENKYVEQIKQDQKKPSPQKQRRVF